MNFFQQPTLPSKGTQETVKKKHEPWNKGTKGATVHLHRRGKDWLTKEGRERLKLKALESWSDPVWVANRSNRGRKMRDEEKKMRSEVAKQRGARETNGWGKTNQYCLHASVHALDSRGNSGNGILTFKKGVV